MPADEQTKREEAASHAAIAMLAALKRLQGRGNFNNPAHKVYGCTFYMSADEYTDLCAAISAADAAGIRAEG